MVSGSGGVTNGMVATPQTAIIRRHEMPFGAQVLPNGHVQFQLWAPRAKQVEVVLDETGQSLSMEKQPRGFFRLITDEAHAGSRYRFRINGADPLVPDPASRYQPDDVHGPSQVVDPASF